MLTLEMVIAMALRHEKVMAQLGAALTNDLVCANPFHRRIVEHASAFARKYGKLPSSEDYQVWFETLESGIQLDGTREALSRLMVINVSDFQPEYLTEVALEVIRRGASKVFQARLNESGATPEAITLLNQKLAAITVASAQRQRLFPTIGDLQHVEYDREESEAEVLIPRLAWRGRFVLFAGREKLGKSTFVAAGAVAMTSAAIAFLDGQAAHGRVLWLGMDEALSDARSRLIHNGAVRTQFVVESPPDPAAFLRLWLPEEAHRPDLVVIDSLIEYTRRTTREMPASGDSGGWAAVVRPLADFAHKYNVGIVAIHHARKSDGDFRDSTEIGAAVDATLTMFPGSEQQDDTVRRLRLVGRRSIGVYSYTVRLEKEAIETYPEPGMVKTIHRDRYVLGAADGDADEEGADREMATRIEQFVMGTPGVSQADIFEEIGGNQNATHRVIKSLAAQGVLREMKDGKTFKYLPRTKPAPRDAAGESES